MKKCFKAASWAFIGAILCLTMGITAFAYDVDFDSGREEDVLGTEVTRAWGWSTVNDSETGESIYHYSHAYMDHILGGSDVSNGRVWGYGKVYSRSPWVDDIENLLYQAKFNYGWNSSRGIVSSADIKVY